MKCFPLKITFPKTFISKGLWNSISLKIWRFLWRFFEIFTSMEEQGLFWFALFWNQQGQAVSKWYQTCPNIFFSSFQLWLICDPPFMLHYGPANAGSPKIEFWNCPNFFGGIFRYMYSENNHQYILEPLKPLPSYSGFCTIGFCQFCADFHSFTI